MEKNGSTIGQAQKKAKKAILTRYAKTTGKTRDGKKAHSWRQLGKQLGFAPDYLRQVVIGERKASIKLLRALDIKPDAVMVIAAPCRKCGQVHVSKRCTKKPTKKTFEQNCVEYDEWLASPTTQQELAKMLTWAETPPEQRERF